MSTISIKSVKSNGELMDFIRLPHKLYQSEKYYVPYLDADRKKFFDRQKNPFFRHAKVEFYLAYKEGKLAGRIAAIINDLHNEYHGEKIGFFGFFDCIDDFGVAESLMAAAEKFVRNAGMSLIRGPMNFSTNDEIGLLIEGFDSLPVFMMTWNPPYYIPIYEKLGLKKVEDVFAYYIDDSNAVPERIKRVVEKTMERSRITIRTINMNDFDHELEIVRKIYNSAWSKNWGFVPMTPEEFDHLAADFKKIIEPELVYLAFVDNEPAGFSLAMPDYNPVFKKMNGKLFPIGLFKFLYYTKVNKLMKGARIITMGIVHAYHKIGLDMVLFYKNFTEGPRLGYHWGEMSWILERNELMNKGAVTMGGKLYKKYRVFDKAL